MQQRDRHRAIVDLEALVEEVPAAHAILRIVRELEGPITELAATAEQLAGGASEDAPFIVALRQRLDAVEKLVRDLCMTLLAMPTLCAEPSEHPASVLSGVTVLVIDEHQRDPRELTTRLRVEGASVLTAATSAECIVRVAAQRPQVVVLDLVPASSIPSLLASIAPHVPIIAATPASNYVAAALALSRADAFIIRKPHACSEVIALLEEILIEPRTAR